MKNVVFKTGGDWDSTTLFVNGTEYPAAQLRVELHAGREDQYDAPGRGGVYAGGEIIAYIRPQDSPNIEEGLFPGHVELYFPGHTIVIENLHPQFVFEATNINYNNRDVSNHVVDLFVNIDAVSNEVQAYITLYKAHWLSADEVATYSILG